MSLNVVRKINSSYPRKLQSSLELVIGWVRFDSFPDHELPLLN